MSKSYTLPTREKDGLLSLGGGVKASFWKEKDHLVYVLRLKDGRNLVLATTEEEAKVTENIRDCILASFLREYALNDKVNSNEG